MKIEYINPFVSATMELFQTMMNLQLKVGRPTLEREAEDTQDVSGVIGLAGGVLGTVVIRFPGLLALRLASLYAGLECKVFDEFVIDTVGEIVNIISANAKASLSGHRVLISIPNVFRGQGQPQFWPSHTPRITVPFDCGRDRFTLTVSFKEAI